MESLIVETISAFSQSFWVIAVLEWFINSLEYSKGHRIACRQSGHRLFQSCCFTGLNLTLPGLRVSCMQTRSNLESPMMLEDTSVGLKPSAEPYKATNGV